MKSKKNRKNNLNLQHNKYVMYGLLVVAVINLVMFLQKNYLGSILLFFIVGLITTLYTKNMNIILFSTIIITNITVFVAKMFGYAEGMGPLTNKNDKPIKRKGGDGKKTNLKMVNQPLFAITKSKKDDDDDDDEGFTGFRGGAESILSLTGKAFKEGYAGKKKEGNTGMKKEKKEEEEPRKPLTKPPPPKSPVKETMQNKKPKPMEDEEGDDDDEGFKSIKEDIVESENLTKSLRKNNISKETEKEIKKMLKGTDIKNLNTNELIEQQKGLMDAMKNMDPLIKSVNEMIKNLKDSPISGFMGLGK